MKKPPKRKGYQDGAKVTEETKKTETKNQQQQPAPKPELPYWNPSGVTYTQGFTPDPQKWNEFQTWLTQQQVGGKSVVGSTDLDIKDRKISQGYVDQWNKANPTKPITTDDLRYVQDWWMRQGNPINESGTAEVNPWLGSKTSQIRFTGGMSYIDPSQMTPGKKKENLVYQYANKTIPSEYKVGEIPYSTAIQYDTSGKPIAPKVGKPVFSAPSTVGAIVGFKRGGRIMKYDNGGTVNENDLINSLTPEDYADYMGMPDDQTKKSFIQNLISTGKLVMPNASQMGGLYSTAGSLASQGVNALDARDGNTSMGGQIAAGALKGAGHGAAFGSMFGPVGTGVGAGVGAIIGGISGGRKQKKADELASQENELAAQASAALAGNTANYTGNFKTYGKKDKFFKANGGKIEGKGGPKEDKIGASIEEDSFVVPAEYAKVAEQLRKKYLNDKSGDANLKQGGGVKVKLSDGEHLFTPEEVKILTAKGIDLNQLAPDARPGDKLKDGGLSRKEDFGSEKKPYPSVEKKDFAGKDRSYPIPTKADAIDALRFAGLHGNDIVRAKVIAKYPDLKKEKGYQEGGKINTEPMPENLKKAINSGKKLQKGELMQYLAWKEKQLAFYEKNKSSQPDSHVRIQTAKREINNLKKSLQNIPEGGIDYSVITGGGYKKMPNRKPTDTTTTNDNEKSNNIGGSKQPIQQKSNVPTLSFEDVRYKAPEEGDYEPQLPVTETTITTTTPEQKTTETTFSEGPEVKEPSAGKKVFDALGGAAGLASLGQTAFGLGTLINQRKKRPFDDVDPTLISRRDQAIQEGGYGLTDTQKTLAKSGIEMGRRSAALNALSLSGGDTGTALANIRQQNLQANRGLTELAAQDELVKSQKQQRADQLSQVVAEHKRRVFEDDLNAFNMKQQAASALLGAGLQNFFGNLMYQDTLKRQDERDKKYGNVNVTIGNGTE